MDQETFQSKMAELDVQQATLGVDRVKAMQEMNEVDLALARVQQERTELMRDYMLQPKTES